MDIQTLLILLLIGLLAGCLSGIVGIGGGIIIVPCLVYFLGFTQHTAQGTSLAVLIMPVGIMGVLHYYRAGHVDIKAALGIAAGFVAGSYFGSRLALNLPQETLKKVFAVLLLLIGTRMLLAKKKPESPSATLTASDNLVQK